MLDSQSMNSYHEKRKLRGKERLVEVLDFNFEIHLHYLKPRIISLKGCRIKNVSPAFTPTHRYIFHPSNGTFFI